ncbi:MAG: ketoacyl-ACP synthase III [Clostridiales bacterium]|jgi:3-oxoacyl-[acyl-carrier-protein] synthase-3|nr:ketoacyl-ACP synthase III [Clostridiales bacterium]
MNCKGLKILAHAHYVPPRVVTNDEISTWVETTDEWIVKRTGIGARHISQGENTSDLCVHVARRLLAAADMDAGDIDLLLVATVTPDYLSPSVACMVQEAVGAAGALAFDVNAACSGFVYGLSVAQKFLAAGQYRNVMVIGAELLSKYVDWTDRNTCVLFGDGAGGMILTVKDGLYAEKLHTRGAMPITVSHQQVVNPFCQGTREIDHIKVDGREVFEFAVKSVSENIVEVLAAAGLTLGDIAYVIPHQANGRIIEGIAKKLRADISKFYINIEKFGNTSSASIPIAFDEMMGKGLLKSGDKVIFAGFGGGLTWGCILIEL